MRRWAHMLVGFVAVMLCLFPMEQGEGVDLVVRWPDWYESCRHRIPREEIVFPVVVYLAETNCGLRWAARQVADRHREQQGLPATAEKRYTEEDRAYMRGAYPEKIPSPLYLGYFIWYEDDTVQFVQKTKYPFDLFAVTVQNGERVASPWDDPLLWLNKAKVLCLRGEGPGNLFFADGNWGATRITFGMPPQDDYVPVFQFPEEHRAEDLLEKPKNWLPTSDDDPLFLDLDVPESLRCSPRSRSEWLNMVPGMGYGRGVRHCCP